MQTFTVTITHISDETHDTRTFTTDRPEGFDFSPGQYCLFWLDGFSRSRPFTIASTPDEHHLDFTIKRIGEFTTAMFELKKRDSLKITFPRDSKLSIKEPPTNPIVLIAGGSGITPFYPIIKLFSSRSEITLLYSNRTDNDIIFREQLRRLAQENDPFHVQF
ncbi:MAG: ferredoxin--NADP reductase, partial [Nanoarchaeota archaeon]